MGIGQLDFVTAVGASIGDLLGTVAGASSPRRTTSQRSPETAVLPATEWNDDIAGTRRHRVGFGDERSPDGFSDRLSHPIRRASTAVDGRRGHRNERGICRTRVTSSKL